MKKKNIFLFLFVFINFQILTSFAFAQNISNSIPGCPYTFSKNLQYTATDNDVVVMQQILNSDKRTIIAYSGVGSPGQETNYFGRGTRDALKRFQALFIEYIGLADGKFNDRTREVMQSICTPIDNLDTNTIASSTPQVPTMPLQIVLSSNTNIVSAGTDFKILIDTNKEIQSLTPDSFILDGAILKEIRKLSKQQYMTIITANSDAQDINIQIEADKVTGKDNTKNDEASNEILMQISDSGIAASQSIDPFSSITQTLSNLLQQTIAGTPATQYCNGVQILASQTCTPQSQPAQPAQPTQSSQPQQNSTMDMITGLLGGLMGGGSKGGGSSSGGNSSVGNPLGGNANQQGATGGDVQGDLEMPNSGDQQKGGPVNVPATTPESCKQNYGFVITGGCSTKDLTGKITQQIANAGMQACAANGGKPVPVTSIHRTPDCNSRSGGSDTSNHLNGAAIDVPPYSTFITKIFEQNGLRPLLEGDHWHYSASGR